MPRRTVPTRWVTVCLHETALQLSEVELRAELGRWVPGKVWLPGVVHGHVAASHPYALFAFVPADQIAAARAARRSRVVEQVLLPPVDGRELEQSLARVGQMGVGAHVRVEQGPLAGVEGEVIRALRHALLVRITLRSGDRTVWVRRWEVAE